MNICKSNKQEAYYQINTWANDVYSHAVIWRNWALLIALLALIIAIITLIALTKIFPLKENTPFLVFVDSQKGEPVSIRPIVQEALIENEQLKKYMIRKFIIARERYHTDTLHDDEHIVSVLANESVYQGYRHHLSKSNPMSPLVLYKDASLDVSKINILFLNEQRAYVSFTLLLNQEGLTHEIPVNADIKFHFTARPLSMDDAQIINPVNFEVLSYQSHYQTYNEVLL